MQHSVYGDLPDLWTAAQLKNVCEINPRLPQSVALEADTEVSFVPMSAVDEVFGTIAAPETRTYDEVMRGFTPFINGDVLFAKITPSMQNGKAAVVADLVNGVGFGSTEFHVFRPGPLILPEWVFALIRRADFRKIAEASFTGTGGQQRVPANFIENFPIPLPPLPEQQHIVEILRAAAELRQLRAQANQRAQDLLPALFHEMFGPQITKKNQWQSKPLSQFGDVNYGLTVNQKRRNADEKKPYLRVANVYRWSLDLSEINEIGVFDGDLERYSLQDGDVLVVEGHADPNQLGRAAFWSGELPECLHQNHLLRVRPHVEFATPHFLAGYINSEPGKQYMLRFGKTSSGLNTINSRVLAEMPIPDVPIQQQQEFTRRYQEIVEAMALQTDSTDRFSALLESLLARAFTGELTAEWREANHAELAQAARERDELLGQKTSITITAPVAEQLPLPLAQPTRAAHAALDKRTDALLAAAEARPAYFRPEDLVGDNGLNLVQAEAGLRVLAALGFVRMVQLDGRRVWRLVDAVDESVEKPSELAS